MGACLVTLELRTVQTSMEGSSVEFCAMNESLTQRFRNGEEVYLKPKCKVVSISKIMTLNIKEIPVNFVPAAAGIQRG